jgi:hypothetical protein
MATVSVFHTSPEPITKIGARGTFGSHLCFADRVYAMAQGPLHVYRLDLDEGEIVESGRLLYADTEGKIAGITQRIMELAECDEDTADELLSQRADVSTLEHIAAEDAADIGWKIQRLTAEAGRLLGYRGVSMQDEQGTVYLIDMLGRESELVDVTGRGRQELYD